MGACGSKQQAAAVVVEPPKETKLEEQPSQPQQREAPSQVSTTGTKDASEATASPLIKDAPIPVASNHGNRERFASYASGASTPDEHSQSDGSVQSQGRNPKTLAHSASAIGLDEMIEIRRDEGDLRQNVVHIEVPFGKPIEEVYDGVHTGPILGSGISGLVRLVTHKATGLKYAVKCLDLGLVATTEGLRQLREEIFIMCQLDHPNIVRLEEVYESHSEIYLVQELCTGGELFDRLDEQEDYHYTEAECARLVKNMLNAVRYLHSRGIIHRDLKLENFLFSSRAQDSELKMIDFGLSKHFNYGEVQHEAVGTPYTVAPEVIRGSYDERCDIWAIGVITFLLLSGDPPFGGCGGPESLMTVRANILSGAFSFEPEDIWELVSPLAREFIKVLLVTDPQERPTASEAQNHSWLKEWATKSKKLGDNVLNPNVVKALVSFKEFSDMKKLLCEVLSFTLLPDQIKDLRKEFEKLDTDGSGEISLASLKKVLLANANAGSLGALTEEEVEDIFNAMRVKKSETRIHWHEFIAAGLSQCKVDDRNLRLAFDRLDIDHKGYVTQEDIMELMGSDALNSDEIAGMWADSLKQAKCQHARIMYDDFLLLMKGQTTDPTDPTAPLGTVAEESMPLSSMEQSNALSLLGGSNSSLTRVEESEAESKPEGLGMSSNLMPVLEGHSPEVEEDFPLSMDDDDDDDINVQDHSGAGVPGPSASLTPPLTPTRGAADYLTPLSASRLDSKLEEMKSIDDIVVPALPPIPRGPLTRRRSRSVDDKDPSPNTRIDSRRALTLPEHDHTHEEIDSFVKDETKSALAVNRKLYRAHRKMRLAVLEASKRFEEQQAQHAREVLEAQRNKEEGNRSYHAGLVMRHGHKEQVSSEAIKKMLSETKVQQQKMVEVATRRGGRGRRTRKKTISDMSGMLSSMGQDELGDVANEAASPTEHTESLNPALMAAAISAAEHPVRKSTGSCESKKETTSDEEELLISQLRKPTVPGDFRKTSDPFGADGLYGALAAKSGKMAE